MCVWGDREKFIKMKRCFFGVIGYFHGDTVTKKGGGVSAQADSRPAWRIERSKIAMPAEFPVMAEQRMALSNHNWKRGEI